MKSRASSITFWLTCVVASIVVTHFWNGGEAIALAVGRGTLCEDPFSINTS